MIELTPAPGSKKRLSALVETLIDENDIIPKGYHAVIKPLINNFLKKLPDEKIDEMIVQLRDAIIPFILYDKH